MKRELAAITEFYGDRRAERSGVPLINHIHEGLIVLNEIHAWHASYSVYCLHPIIQSDADFNKGVNLLKDVTSPKVAALTCEYRHTANAWLSDKVDDNMMLMGMPKKSPHEAVNNALIADKVQNRADFEIYHRDHPRARQLSLYFRIWLETLGVSEKEYQELAQAMKTRFVNTYPENAK